MATNYDDDEKIVDVRKKAAPGLGSSKNDGVTATVYSKPRVSLDREKITVLLELTGMESNERDERPGLDIVIVLDVSRSMKGDKLQNLKTACTFLIKKLSPIDRVSVIKFSQTAEKLHPLTLMTSGGKSKIEQAIRELTTGYGTNMNAGLNEAVKVLKHRRFTDLRLAAIMLMTDDGDTTSEAMDVDCGDIPVHTFGLGCKYNPMLLAQIARRSVGGTFNASDADNPAASSLCRAFAICLGGLLSVVATDLKMVIQRGDSSEKLNVSIGNYPQTQDDVGGTVTIELGNLYAGETRNVLVDVVLDKVDKPKDSQVLKFSYSYYKEVGKDDDFKQVTVKRRKKLSKTEIIKVQEEVARVNTSRKIKKALNLADKKDFDNAVLILAKAVKDLEKRANSLTYESSPLVKKLIEEVNQFVSLMETNEKYVRSGCAFGYASELSHALQRASGGGYASQTRLFETPAMKQAADQASEYEINPEYKVATSNDSLNRIQRKKEKEAKNNKMICMNERVANQKVAKKNERENKATPEKEKTLKKKMLSAIIK